MGAFWRSALVPGWGQFYNRSYLKALVVSAGRVALAVRGVQEQRLADRLERRVLELDRQGDIATRDNKWVERNMALARRDNFIWWSVFAWTLSVIDAYVDASLVEFSGEFEGLDEGDEKALSVRIGLSFAF